MIPREISLPQSESFFLFGARAVGKSTLLRHAFTLPPGAYIDLLDAATEQQLSQRPDRLLEWVAVLPQRCTHVVIDEIQRVPKLLDVVHQAVESESTGVRFIMTGSSARKLKAGGANLLAGRAFLRSLFPFSAAELGSHFDLADALQFGTLPRLVEYTSDADKVDYLFSYAASYVREEVWTERLIKNLDPFRRFLEVAAQMNGKVVNFALIARDVGVDIKTVQNYFSILEETLLGFFVESFHTSARKRLKSAPKFYLFDVGVARTLAGVVAGKPQPQTSYYGELFEQFLVCELHRRISYHRRFWKLCFLRTASNLEIDLVIDRPGNSPVLVEVKSTTRVLEKDVKILNGFQKEFPESPCYLLSCDTRGQKMGATRCLPWREGIDEILSLG